MEGSARHYRLDQAQSSGGTLVVQALPATTLRTPVPSLNTSTCLPLNELPTTLLSEGTSTPSLASTMTTPPENGTSALGT